MIRDSAIIFSPTGIPLGAAARYTLTYARRRAYSLIAVASEWTLIHEMLAAKRAKVVLFADEPDVVLSDVALSNEATHAISADTLRRSRQPAADSQDSIYETARLLPRGDDGGLAETFLTASRRSRHTGDT